MSELEQKKQEEDGAQVEVPGLEGPAPMGAPIGGPLLQRKIAQRLQRKKDEKSDNADTADKGVQEAAAPAPGAPQQQQQQQALAPVKHKYSASGAQRAYTVGGHDVAVFLPPGELKGPAADVFVFFHGLGGDYASKGSNTAKNAHLAEAIAASGKIGMAPIGGAGANWEKWKPGDFKALVDGALAQLGKELGLPDALVSGQVSLAGHSAGGKALGQAALDMDVPEVTLQDAGYGKFDGKVSANYNNSWDKLDKWFLTGTAPKTLRVIAHDKKGSGDRDASTRYATENKEHGFSEAALTLHMNKLVSEGALPAPLTIATLPGDNTPRVGSNGGMRLESKLTATRPDGKHQGTVYVYYLQTHHDGVRNETMEAAAKGGGDDFGKIDLKTGSYTVTDGAAYVRDDKDLSKFKLQGGKKIAIPKGEKVNVTEFKMEKDTFALVEGYGWTKLSNLKADAGGDKK